MFNLFFSWLIILLSKELLVNPWGKSILYNYSALFSTFEAHIWNNLELGILHVIFLQKGIILLWKTYLANWSEFTEE